VLGIIGLVVCTPAAPFAWRQGKQAEDAVSRQPGTYGGKGMATAGKIMGIIGSVILVLGVIIAIIVIIAAVASN